MPNKKPVRKRTTSSRQYRRRRSVHRHGLAPFQFIKKRYSKAWIVGGLAVTALYIWAFWYFFVGPTGFRWRAFYGDAKYPEGYEIHGIDISRYQGKINWDRLRSNALIDGCPLRFIIVKATEGSSKIDPNFNDNFIRRVNMVSFVEPIISGAQNHLRAPRLIFLEQSSFRGRRLATGA